MTVAVMKKFCFVVSLVAVLSEAAHEGCTRDKDCLVDHEWCELDTGICQDKRSIHENCHRDRVCWSEHCLDGKCRDSDYPSDHDPCERYLSSGTSCSLDCECSSGWCHPEYHRCDSKGDVGDPCDYNYECQSNKCDGHTCLPSKYPIGGDCSSDSQCTSGWCHPDYHKCRRKGDVGEPCDYNYECHTKRCDGHTCQPDKLPIGDGCSRDNQCQSGWCHQIYGTCLEKFKIGNGCAHDYECASGYCGSSKKCAKASTIGDHCTAHSDCPSGHWCNPHYRNDRAGCDKMGDLGEYCDNDKGCKSGHCDNQSHPPYCYEKKSDGGDCDYHFHCHSEYCNEFYKCAQKKSSGGGGGGGGGGDRSSEKYCSKHKDCDRDHEYCDYHTKKCVAKKWDDEWCEDHEECKSHECECDCFLWVFHCSDHCYCEGHW